MSTKGFGRSWAVLTVLGMLGSGAAQAAPLTADEAVKVALRTNGQVVSARAGILDARSGLYGATGALLPSLSVSMNRSESQTDDATGADFIGNTVFPRDVQDSRSSSSSTTLSSSIGLLDLSNWASYSAAKQNMKASRYSLDATRNDVALATRRQFYNVVTAIKLAEVATGGLRRSRDDERRVNAMFQVGSVSKSDLLKAQVATAQAELDSITASNAIVVQRVVLANQMGVRESELGEVDTLLAGQGVHTYDEAAILAEAARNRPDLMAAEAEMRGARSSHTAARLARLPYVTAGGSATLDSKAKTRVIPESDPIARFENSSDQQLSAQVALRWDVFNLGAIDAGIASARARLDRATETRNALQRNLAGEVHEALLAYNEAVSQNAVATRGLESATENLKLTQEKYNVGSATILELIDAQVLLQTAQSNVVKALAAIRVAEAQINRVRGQGQ